MSDVIPSHIGKSFDFAADATKQVINLSTAVLAISATFADKVFTGDPAVSRAFCALAWVLLMVSIVCGIWTLLQLTTALARVSPGKPPSIMRTSVAYGAAAQHLSFIAALAVLAGYGVYVVGK